MLDKSERDGYFEENVCPISLIPISELEDPVICRDSGRIYNRPELIQWIEKHGVDPISKTPLTMEMLASGKYVKQILVESRQKLQTLEKDVSFLMKEHQNERKQLIDMVNEKMYDFQKEMNYLISEKNEYKMKLELLAQKYTNNKWYIHGGMKIDDKLKRGCSTNYKTEFLTFFAESYKKSYTHEQEQEAIQEGLKCRNDFDLRGRNGLFSSIGQSESSKLVEEFIKNLKNA